MPAPVGISSESDPGSLSELEQWTGWSGGNLHRITSVSYTLPVFCSAALIFGGVVLLQIPFMT